jgi:YVTN family beta-propeller protein
MMVGRSMGAAVDLRASGFDLYLPGGDSPALTVNLLGARRSTPAGTEMLPSKTNYLIGNDPSRWTSVANYRRVTYSSLYPGIDLVFYGSGPRIEHDFIVSPGADFRSIRMGFGNRVHPSLTKEGGLSVALQEGTVEFEKPVIYQTRDGQREPVSGHFRVLPNGDIGFAVSKYDRRRPLIIDPVLSFATYLSQYSGDASDIAVDSAGNSYVTGYASLGYPITAGAFAGCGSCGSSNVVTFISKLSSDGSSLVYSTILGGNSFAQPTGIAVDSKGNAIVSGWTGASDFPTKNGQPILPQNNNYVGFLVSLSADGSSLNFGTLLSQKPSATQGSMTYAAAVAVDGSDNVYVTGETGNGFPVTPGALNQGGGGVFGNQFNVYVAKFGSTGSLLYSAVIGTADPQNGGGGPIGASALTVDAAGNAYVAGQAGTLWPITSNAYLKQIAGSMPYATPFVTKVAPDAKSLIYSTFLDYAYVVTGISVLSNGNVFVAGTLVGPNHPTTSNAYQKGSATGGEAFLTELDSTGSSLVYATVIGDSSFQLAGLALDPGNQNIWIAAGTGDAQFTLVTPLQNTFPTSFIGLGGPVSTVVQFDPTGQTLLFSTYLGGPAAGYANSVAVDAQHRAHVSGAAQYGMYTTPGVYDSQVPVPGPGLSGATYGYVALIDTAVAAPALCVTPNAGLLIAPVTVGTYSDTNVTITSCGNRPLTVTGATAASGVFTIPSAGNKCTQSLPVGQSCTLAVRYTPKAAGNDSSTLKITSDASVTEAVIPLSGTGVVPHISVNNYPIFDYTLVGQTSAPQMIFIQNIGGAPLVLDASKTGTSGDFSIQGLGNCSTPITSACSLNVYFSPKAPGTRTGVLSIASNDAANPVVTVQLAGTGYTAAPVPEISGTTSQLIQAGAPETGFIVTGFGFMPTSVVQLNGVTQATSYLSSTTLRVDLVASSIPNSYGELPLTVVTPGPGGGTSVPFKLTEFQVLPITNANLVYEPVSNKLIVSTPASDSTNPNTVAIIDPATLTVTKRIPAGNDPAALAVSDDGKYLYVALNGDHAIQRINLATYSIEKTLILPVDPTFDKTIVFDMHVAPGNNTEVIATIELPNVSPYEDGIAEFNGTGLVNWIPGQYVQNGQNTILWLDHFTFTNSNSPLYARQTSSNTGLAEISYGTGGLQVSGKTCCTASAPGQLDGQHLASDGTLIYTDTGLVWDPSSNKVVKTFAVEPETVLDTVLPDSSTGKTYFLNPLALYSQYEATTVQAFDSNTAALTGSLSFTNNTNITSAQGMQLVRWGTNGFAYRAFTPSAPPSTELFLFTSSISSSNNVNPVPVETSLSPGSTAAGGGDFTLTVTGTGFVSGSTIEWNGTPRITTYVSSTKLTATIYASDIASSGTAQVLVASPGPGGDSSLALSFTIAAVPAVTLSPTSLTFASQMAGTTSGPQVITVSNTGSSALNGIAIAISGTNASAFGETTTCGTTLAAGSTCNIGVTFSPSAAGNFTANLNVSDNAAGSPQSVPLSGTAPQSPLSIGTQTGGSTSSTVTAGQPASYSLSIVPAAGYSGTVTLSCSNLPANASCSFTPASLSLSGGKAASLTVTVATETTTTAENRVGAISIAFAITLIFWPTALKRRRLFVMIGLVMLAVAIVVNLSACGGSSGTSGTGPTTSKVAPGTYTFQLIASDGTAKQTQSLTLTVQ